jgi:hypothetical protein
LILALVFVALAACDVQEKRAPAATPPQSVSTQEAAKDQHEEPRKAAKTEKAGRLVDDFNLPLVIHVEAPAVPPEIERVSPSIEEESPPAARPKSKNWWWPFSPKPEVRETP